MCPFDTDVCGASRTIQVSETDVVAAESEAEAEIVMTNLGNAKSSDFIFGQLCSYEVKWPKNAVYDDEIVLTAVTLAEGAEVYIASGAEGLFSASSNKVEMMSEDKLSEGKELRIKYPA